MEGLIALKNYYPLMKRPLIYALFIILLLLTSGCMSPHTHAVATNETFSGTGDAVFLTTVTNGGQFLMTSSVAVNVKITTPDGNILATPLSESAQGTTPDLIPGNYVIVITGAGKNYTVTMTGL
jgi:hypothetical protein